MGDTLIIEISRPHAVDELNKLRHEASERAFTEGVFDLLQRKVISVGQGAALLGIGMDVLLDGLQQREIPVADYGKDELSQEVEAALQDFQSDNDADI